MDRLQQYLNYPNITTSKTSRRTVDGRRLTYRLHVLQQPEKARACGNGAKASADRRPVDPPPVIELRVFEGEDDDNLRDITTTYHNVNFFLFATLEQRPVANGRIHTPGPPSVGVLNGVNVAGINYLERPSPAGYFLFPDLSVRHEGFYRLTFGLYEQVKDARDADPDRPFPTQAELQADANSMDSGPPKMYNSTVQRLEVRSEEFQVYSAKKFPGLDRSTGLSIGLSDQGCRVRIRRDVRMRKRPNKHADRPFPDESLHANYAGQEALPMAHGRPRSLSQCSRDGSQYGERRLTVHTGELYSHPPAPSMGPAPPLSGSTFALPSTPSSTAPQGGYYHSRHPSTSLPSPVSAGPSRPQEHASRPNHYQGYEHRGSDASSVYSRVEFEGRRPSDVASFYPEPAAYRHADIGGPRPMERPTYPGYDGHRYHPSEGDNGPAHYAYARETKVPHAREQPLLPSVSELIKGADAREAEMHPGKRSYSPSRYDTERLTSGMRPSAHEYWDDLPTANTINYRRANGYFVRSKQAP